MFKVLLVDDEEEVRQGIRDKIDWAKFNFSVIGEAENGREALNFFDEVIPDIVITDINMPFMDGLELTAEIKENYPIVKVVILTGFDDFKFAQTAIKYGVYDYILKPVLPKDINDLLLKLQESLNAEINEKKDLENLRIYYQESIPLLRENYLVSMILGKPGAGTITDKFKELNINVKGNWYSASILKIDSESVTDPDSRKDIELKKFAIFNITKEILLNHNSGESFFHDDGIVIIIGIDCKDRTTARNKMFSILDEIRQNVKKYLRLTVSIGFGYIVETLENIRMSYLSSQTARRYKLILSGDKVIFVEDLEPGINNFFHLNEDREEALISSIKFGEETEVSKSVDSLFIELNNKGASLKEYQLYFMEIISVLMKMARFFQIESKEVLPQNSGMYTELDNFDSIDQAKTWIGELCINLMKSISGKRLDAAQLLFEKARDYIDENYHDQELNVQRVSDHLFISPSYLCLIFKKKADETFLKYVMKIRLEKAKEMLLDNSNKIADVAEKVGYPDVSYFSYFFKKNTGLSPREYKKGN